MNEGRVYAYMSGALTNLGAGLEIPPCCKMDPEVRARLTGAGGAIASADLRALEREQKAHYERLRDRLRQPPLGVDLYLPHKHSDPEHDSDLAPETVYHVDRLRVTSSSMVIACLDIPSIGVGQEIEIAMNTGIPVVCYRHTRSRVSRMPLGNPIVSEDIYGGLSQDDESGRVITYEGEEDLFDKLGKRVSFLRRYLGGAVRPRRPREDFADRLRSCAERSGGITTRELAALAGVPPTFIAFLQKASSDLEGHFDSAMPSMVPHFREILSRYDFDRFSNPSLTVLRRLAHALNVTVAELIGEGHVQSELPERVLNTCERHHGATAREYYIVMQTIPPGLAFSKLDEHVAREIKRLRGR
jgi:transcriptional regulator with XRE-family HTH domain